MYVIFLVNGSPQESISWGLQFSEMNECIEFVNTNIDDVIIGTANYADKFIEGDTTFKELGCARAFANFDAPEISDDPQLDIKVKLY